MSTIEDFENAPIGATATAPNGDVALNTGRFAFDWAVYNSSGGFHALLRSDELKGFTIDPTHPAPTTAREALELAWELAHPVKEGQEMPEGTQYVHKTEKTFVVRTLNYPYEAYSWDEQEVRTLDPLPEPEPDWMEAPAVLAWSRWDDVRREKVWSKDDGCYKSIDGEIANWSDLCYVTPLYPKDES